jgi:hypothetical protein
MARAGPYDHNDYGIYHESDEDTVLFTLELNSAPALHSRIVYTPLVGASVIYKVEQVVILAMETVIPAGAGPGAGAALYGMQPILKVIVSTVP